MREIVLMVTATFILASPSAAQQPVGSFETLWSHVKSGDVVYVTDGAARATTGTLVKLTDGILHLVVDGQVREIPSVEVREIARRGDSVLNGFLIGATVGTAIGVGAFMACEEHEDCLHPAVGGLIIGLEFGGIGALIDHFIRGRTVVYRSQARPTVDLSPLVFGHRRGMRVSFSF
jgi:hypothetical protein